MDLDILNPMKEMRLFSFTETTLKPWVDHGFNDEEVVELDVEGNPKGYLLQLMYEA